MIELLYGNMAASVKFLLSALLLSALLTTSAAQEYTLQTSLGSVIGLSTFVNGKEVQKFLGNVCF